MDNNQNTLARIQEITTKCRSAVILIPSNPSIDAIGASTSLYLALSKMGKTVSIACSQISTSDLVASDKIQNIIGVGGDSLMVSFPYSDGAIDKVDYNIQGQSFNLVITPRPGFKKLDPNQVKFSYTGGLVDVIFVIDAPTLNSLGTIYSENQNQFNGKDIINIDRHLTNAYFGTVNYVNKTISSISELILTILKTLGVEIDRDMATNLYAGVAASTNNFTSYSTNADTFENIAILLRAGAVKKTFKKPVSFQRPQPQVINSIPSRNMEAPKTGPIESVETDSATEKPQTSQEWLKPKIFKGGGLI
jgi:nanoRNase/pAp phosphatase (c-di-AMP/oligoRNAs hydrolase)